MMFSFSEVNLSGLIVLAIASALSLAIISVLNKASVRPGARKNLRRAVAAEEPLQTMVPRTNGALPGDRRRAPRRSGNPVNVLIHDGLAAIPIEGVVIDRSTGGVCIALPQPKAPGIKLEVRAAGAPDTFAWVPVEVRHCRRKGERWLIGCKFEKRLMSSEMVHFG
jgi:hypothetical protein